MFSKEKVRTASSPGNICDIFLQHYATAVLLFSFSKCGVTRVTFLNSELFLYTLRINAKALTGLSVRSSQRKRSCSHAVCERVFLTKLSNSVVFMSNTSSGAVVLCRLAIPARLSCCFRCLHGYFSKLALLTRSLHKEPFANHIFDIGLQAACNLQGYCRESFQMQMTKYSPNFSITY